MPVLAAKNSTPLPKMELLFILKKVPVLAAWLLFTMITQFEAKEFTFLTSAQQQNHSSYLLTSSLTYMKPHSTGVTLDHCYILNSGASRFQNGS